MKYVLHTCNYFSLVDDQTKLSAPALAAMGDATNSFHLSAITVTETHRLVRKGKVSIHAPNGLDDWFQKGLTQHRVTRGPITLAIAPAAEMLPTIPPTTSFSLPQKCSLGEFSRRTRSCRNIPASRPSGNADVAQVSHRGGIGAFSRRLSGPLAKAFRVHGACRAEVHSASGW